MIFRLKDEGSPLRIRIADASGSSAQEISLPTRPLPSTFTLKLR